MTTATAVEPGLLSLDELFRVGGVALRARAIADSVLTGTHPSRRFGSSTEFAEHKLYTPGDDLRSLDWKAYARVDRWFVRRTHEESSIELALLVDASGSMRYAGGARGQYRHSKLAYATTLAAALALIAHRQSDATSVQIHAGLTDARLPPRARREHLERVLTLLDDVKPGHAGTLADATHALASTIRRRALVVVISDFLDAGTDPLGPLGVLRRRGADVLVLQVLDPDELEFPFEGIVRFEDLEGDRAVQLDAPAVRSSYLEELNNFLAGIRKLAASRDIRYVLASSGRSPVAVLREALELVPRGGRR